MLRFICNCNVTIVRKADHVIEHFTISSDLDVNIFCVCSDILSLKIPYTDRFSQHDKTW